MLPSRWAELKALFQRALELDGPGRRALLEGLDEDDGDLRARLSRMLEADRDPDFIRPPDQDPALGLAAPRADQLVSGTRCGAYVVDHLLSRGGMGEVYAGRRDDRQFERQVAIKVLRKTFASADFMEHFAVEREALAALEHRYIARLFDAGCLEDGRPYLVMERVDGLPIDAWCDRHAIGLEGRLELFCRVCEAVDAAHRQLIVHRDLKPSNILVTGSGEPRLLDFGVARITQPDRDAAEQPSSESSAPLTVAYASPEQLRGERVTTATDVYALGLLLYELVARRQVHATSRAHAAESAAGLAHALAGDPPTRPSLVLARAGEPELRRAARRVRGDLDAIVAKALHERPEHRYGSVDALAADVHRHLARRPIAARSAPPALVARRWIARNRALAAAVTLLLLSLAAGFVGVVQYARIAHREAGAASEAEEAARVARRRAERTSAFLASILAAPNPFFQGRDVTVLETVDAAARRVERELEDEPRVEAGVRRVLGGTFTGLGRPDEAILQLERALELEVACGIEGRELAATLRELGVARFEAGDLVGARTELQRALAIQERVLGGPHLELAQTLNDLGAAHRVIGNLDEADALHRRALEMRRELAGEADLTVAESLSNLGNVARLRGDLTQAVELAEGALELRAAQLPPEHALVVQSRGNLAVLLASRGEYEPAAVLLEEVLDGARAALGPDHPHLAIVMGNLAGVLSAMGRHVEAEGWLRDSLALNERALPEDNFMIAATAVRLGECLAEQGEHAAALELLGPRLELYEQRFGPDEHETRALRARIDACVNAVGR